MELRGSGAPLPLNGVGALRFLGLQYDSNDANDRAAAVGRLHARYIDSRADISEDDLRLQFDSMMVAEADIMRAGGAKHDESLLISLFDNSLPPSYGTIRQLVRRCSHGANVAEDMEYAIAAGSRPVPGPLAVELVARAAPYHRASG